MPQIGESSLFRFTSANNHLPRPFSCSTNSAELQFRLLLHPTPPNISTLAMATAFPRYNYIISKSATSPRLPPSHLNSISLPPKLFPSPAINHPFIHQLIRPNQISRPALRHSHRRLCRGSANPARGKGRGSDGSGDVGSWRAVGASVLYCSLGIGELVPILREKASGRGVGNDKDG